MESVYLDNNATTAVHSKVVKVIAKTLARDYGNPSSSYGLGRIARFKIETSRSMIGNLLGIPTPHEQLFFTSSATESNNYIIRGRVQHYKRTTGETPHVVTTTIEHSSVIETVLQLTKAGLCTSTFVPVDKNGLVDIKQFHETIKKNKHTALAVVIIGNNEIGTIQDTTKFIKVLQSFPNVYFHADITQLVGKYPLHLDTMGVDSASFCAHKFYGPKGVGGLYLKTQDRIDTVMSGGSQERNIRAGTENTAFIVGMALALQISHEDLEIKMKKIKTLRDWMENKIAKVFPNVVINAPLKSETQRLYNTLSISIPSCDSRQIIRELDKHRVYMNVGSACSKGKRSRVLEAIGLPVEYEQGTFRISLSHYTTKAECRYAIKCLKQSISRQLDGGHHHPL
jgi:cysteine desulfurase